MKPMLIKRSSLWIAIFMIACALSVAIEGFAQGRGHGRGLNKKAGKFINGHDARNGRWDGKGPRPGFVGRTMYGNSYLYRSKNKRKHNNKYWKVYRKNKR